MQLLLTGKQADVESMAVAQGSVCDRSKYTSCCPTLGKKLGHKTQTQLLSNIHCSVCLHQGMSVEAYPAAASLKTLFAGICVAIISNNFIHMHTLPAVGQVHLCSFA